MSESSMDAMEQARADPKTYTEPLDSSRDADVGEFLVDFYANILLKNCREMKQLLDQHPKTIGKYYKQLVPAQVDNAEFWQRYYMMANQPKNVDELASRRHYKSEHNKRSSTSRTTSIAKTTYDKVKLVGEAATGRLCLTSKGLIYYPSCPDEQKVKLAWSSIDHHKASSSILKITYKKTKTVKLEIQDNWTMIQVMSDMVDRTRRHATSSSSKGVLVVDDVGAGSVVAVVAMDDSGSSRVYEHGHHNLMDDRSGRSCDSFTSHRSVSYHDGLVERPTPAAAPKATKKASSSSKEKKKKNSSLGRSEHRPRKDRPQIPRRSSAPNLFACSLSTIDSQSTYWNGRASSKPGDEILKDDSVTSRTASMTGHTRDSLSSSHKRSSRSHHNARVSLSNHFKDHTRRAPSSHSRVSFAHDNNARISSHSRSERSNILDMDGLDNPSWHSETLDDIALMMEPGLLVPDKSDTSRTDVSSGHDSISSFGETPLLLDLLEAQLLEEYPFAEQQEQEANLQKKKKETTASSKSFSRQCKWSLLLIAIFGPVFVVSLLLLITRSTRGGSSSAAEPVLAPSLASSTAPTILGTMHPSASPAPSSELEPTAERTIGRVTRAPTPGPTPRPRPIVGAVTRNPTPTPQTPRPTAPPTEGPTPSPTLPLPTLPPRKPKPSVQYGTVTEVDRSLGCTSPATLKFDLDSAFNFTFAATSSFADQSLPTDFWKEHEAHIAVESMRFLKHELQRLYPDAFDSLTGEEASGQVLQVYCEACQKYDMVYRLQFSVIVTFKECTNPNEVLKSVPHSLNYKSLLKPINKLLPDDGSDQPSSRYPFAEVKAMQGHEECSSTCGAKGTKKPKKARRNQF